MNSDLEPMIRMAIGYIANAQDYAARLPISDSPDEPALAIDAMEAAVESLQDYARRYGIHLRESMKT